MATVIGAVSGLALEISGLGHELESPFLREETPEATTVNALFFLFLLAAGSVLMLLIFKYKRQLLHVIFAASLFASGVVVYWIHLAALAYAGILPCLNDSILFLLSTIITLVFILVVIKGWNEAISSLMTILFGGLTGGLFSFLLPPWSVLAVAVAAALFDVYSVFKGPISKMLPVVPAGEPKGLPSEFRWVVVTFKGLSLGLGDIVFYSMLASLALTYPSLDPVRWFVVSLALLVGAYATFRMLERRPVLPALPIPILISSVVYVVLLYVSS